ncbi:hypothetical protein [Nocardioides nanhaiensis]|uniref:hypothetical protein n=1 Tax=Nocardioides nanhaiensis TaxID=1476871 RepID=UPI0031EE5D54
MKVRSPGGQVWRVSRRWVPWRRRLRGSLDAVPDLPGGLGDDPVSAIVGLVLLVLALPFLVLVLLAGLELLLLLLVLPVALLGRVLLGRHWTVEVRRGWAPWTEQPAGDWQASGVAVHELADRLRRGEVPEQTIGA